MSRELDFEIVEKVFGWVLVGEDDKGPGYWYGPNNEGKGTNCYPNPVRYYSSDIAAAMDVVKKMNENKWGFMCELGEWNWNEEKNRIWKAGFGRITSPLSSDSYKVSGYKSLPLAITKAALKCLEDKG